MTTTGAASLHTRLWAGPCRADVRTVVLVHGLLSSRSMVPTAQRLSRSFRVVAPDLPGFGRTPSAARSLSIVALADLLAAWMSRSHLDGAVVVGHSVGAQIVADLAVRHPAAVGGAVLVAPTVDSQARTVRRQLWSWLANAPAEPLALHLLATYELVEISPRRMVRTLRDAIGDPIEDRLPAMRCPVMLVRGERDSVVRQCWVDDLQRRAPDAEVAVIPRAGHTVVYNAPDRLAQLIGGLADRRRRE